MENFITRDEYHKKKWKKIYWKEDCPFCNSHEFIWESKYRIIVRNISPYTWDKNHLMALPKAHKQFSIDLSIEEFIDFKEVQLFVKEYFWDKHYFSATRESMWNRSVEHLHIHFVSWKLQWKYLRKMLELQWFPIKQDLNI